MIERVLHTAQKITNKITIISGFKAETLEAHINQNFSQITFCRQEEQLGTAHAVKMSADQIINDEKVLILYGDVPLIKQDTLEGVINSDGACLLTTTLDNPTGYGRIVEDEAGHVHEIVEEKDANEDQECTGERHLQALNKRVEASKTVAQSDRPDRKVPEYSANLEAS